MFFMILKETTVYVEYMGKGFDFDDEGWSGRLYKKEEGFFLKKEELIELLGSVWNGCLKNQLYVLSNMGDEWVGEIPKNKEQFINSLFNTEEDGK